jgi:hypothetical protein
MTLPATGWLSGFPASDVSLPGIKVSGFTVHTTSRDLTPFIVAISSSLVVTQLGMEPNGRSDARPALHFHSAADGFESLLHVA